MTELEAYDQILSALQSETQLDVTRLPQAHREDLLATFKFLAETRFNTLDPSLLKRISEELFAAGPIETILNDEEITEILFNDYNSIWVERRGRIQRLNNSFFSVYSYRNFLQRVQIEAGVQANLDRPFADGFWRDFRIHLIIEPVAESAAHLSLRRHPKSPWTLKALQNIGWAPHSAVSTLRDLIHAKQALLIIGGTSSGKTSVLNACLQELSSDERVVCIEDTSEIQLPNLISAKLLSRQDLNEVLRAIDQSELLRQALRMRPDRIVVGEVRGDEARDLLMAFSTGHRGGMSTLHAENPRQSLMRLEMLIQMGAPHWSLRAIRHLILFGIQYIVSVAKTDDGRKLTGIYKISSLEEHGHCLEPIFELPSL